MTDPLDAFRRQGEIDAASPLPIPINWKARAEAVERERDALREALTIANDDAQKLAARLEGESNLVAELSRRLSALERIDDGDVGPSWDAAMAALRESLLTIHGRAVGYNHGDSHVMATFSGIADLARAALEAKP